MCALAGNAAPRAHGDTCQARPEPGRPGADTCEGSQRRSRGLHLHPTYTCTPPTARPCPSADQDRAQRRCQSEGGGAIGTRLRRTGPSCSLWCTPAGRPARGAPARRHAATSRLLGKTAEAAGIPVPEASAASGAYLTLPPAEGRRPSASHHQA